MNIEMGSKDTDLILDLASLLRVEGARKEEGTGEEASSEERRRGGSRGGECETQRVRGGEVRGTPSGELSSSKSSGNCCRLFLDKKKYMLCPFENLHFLHMGSF